MKRILTLSALLALLAGGTAVAGLYYPANRPHCVTNSDGSGSCYGDMLGWRNDTTGTSDRVSLYATVTSPINGFFTAVYEGRSYGCYLPLATNPAFLQTYLADWNYISVKWDASGKCTSLSFHKASYRPFAR